MMTIFLRTALAAEQARDSCIDRMYHHSRLAQGQIQLLPEAKMGDLHKIFGGGHGDTKGGKLAGRVNE